MAFSAITRPRVPPTRYQRVIGHSRPLSEHVTGVAKAQKGQYPVRDAAEAHETQLADAFLAAVAAVQEAVSVEELVDLLRQGDMYGVLDLMDIENRMQAAATGKGLPVGTKTFQEALRDVYEAGARAAYGELADVLVVEKAARKPRIGTEMSFDLLNPEAVRFIQAYTFNLIQQVSQESRLAIQHVVLMAFRTGKHPYEQARDIEAILLNQGKTIRGIVGLTRTQVQAVLNYKDMLASGDMATMRETLTRALRDRRFDRTVLRTIRTQASLPAWRVDDMVQRYYERALRHRAKNIARTETLRASNAGQQELWRQAAEQGYLKPERTRRKWIVTPDDRLCEYCKDIRVRNEDGVPLDEPFEAEDGPVDYPPAHPSCRCATGLLFLKKGEG